MSEQPSEQFNLLDELNGSSIIHQQSPHTYQKSEFTVQSQAFNDSQLQRKKSSKDNQEPLFENKDFQDQNEDDAEVSQSKIENIEQTEIQDNKQPIQQQQDEQLFQDQDDSQNADNFNLDDFDQNSEDQKRKQSDNQSNNQTFIANEENQTNIILKQVPTEATELKNELQQEDTDIQNQEKMLKTQEVLEKFKQVIASPKTRSPQQSSDDPYQLNKPIIKPQPTEELDGNNVEKQVEQNLKEIYKFYSKQAQTQSKQNTFDKINQIQTVMTLQKFMYFCKDFELIDLEITNEFLVNYTGSAATKPLYKIKYKHKEKENFIVTKLILVEVFKKSSNIQELSFQEFLYALIKIADIIFPVTNSLRYLYSYLGVYEPKIYRKKMIVVGKPFNTKDQTEQLTQEKIYARRIILPAKPKPRAESYRHEPPTIEVNNISLQEKPKVSVRNLQKPKEKQTNLIKWEDLNVINKEFDPKELLLEQDLSDKEDEYYLREYMINAKKEQQDDNQNKQEKNIQQNKQNKNNNNDQNVKKENIKETQSKEAQSKANQLNSINVNEFSSSVPPQQKLYKQLAQQQQTQAVQYTEQSVQSQNQTPLLLQKQKQLAGETHTYSQKVQLNKAFKAQAALNISADQGSPNSLRKGQDGLNAIKKLEADQKQREQQIYTAFMKNQEQREKKVMKKQY